MKEKVNKEIHHKTEFVDKKLPTIYYEKQKHKDMSNIDGVVITVSDTTSKEAFETFKKVKELVK